MTRDDADRRPPCSDGRTAAARRADRHVAEPQAHPADPGARDLRDPPVDHVRAAVRVRLRRRDPAARDGGSYREFLMPGIFAQTIVFAAGDHRDRHGRRHATRASSIASGRCRWRARRSSSAGSLVRRRLQRRDPRRADALGPRRRLDASTPGSWSCSPASRLLLLFAFAMSWIGDLARAVGADRRGRPAGRRSRSSSRSRSSRTCSCRPRRCPSWLQLVRRVEPDEHAHRRAPPAVGQPEPVRLEQPAVAAPDAGDARSGSS